MASNRPEGLSNPPIPLLGDTAQQMSFAERATLEGILMQARPRVAVEVGSAEGATLHRIARRAVVVHSFDLLAPAPEVAALPNVRMHLGDSSKTLPAWLGRQSQPIDFALVDGDHTERAVRMDLQALLGSPLCARTVILAHDIGNHEVFAGVLAAVTGAERVVYHELEFLPGYEFAEGPWKGQRWGGFALIVTGDRRHDGYLDHPGQTLYWR